MPIVPDSTSTTSKIGLVKWGFSALCLIGGVIFTLTGNIPLGATLIAVATQGGISGYMGMKSQDATPIPKP